MKNKYSHKKEIDMYESLGSKEIYKALGEELDLMCGHVSASDDQGPILPAIVIGVGFYKARQAQNVERLLHAIQESPDDGFKQVTRVRGNGNGKKLLKANAIGSFYNDIMGIDLFGGQPYSFSEEVELVSKVFRESEEDTEGLKDPESKDPITGRFGYEVFNDAVECIRKAVREEGFLSRRRRRREQARRNFISATRYVKNLFKKYARLLVLRVDFGYRDWANPKLNFQARKKADDIRRDLMRLLNNRRSNTLFDAMVGYIAKIEEGTSKGFHAHTVLFFDGSRVQNDAWLAAEIGGYWNTTITKGEGLFYNCNAHKAQYRRLGIGRINHDDLDKRENLLLAIAYLTKEEQYFCVTDGRRTFFKGVVKPRATAAGRPRRQRAGRTVCPVSTLTANNSFPFSDAI